MSPVSAHVPATVRFDAVVGTRRGSKDAQALRDRAEAQHREQSLRVWAGQVDEQLADLLAGFYRQGEHGYAEGRRGELQRRLAGLLAAHGADAFALADRAGDPDGWPGLTAPAVSALAAYLLSDPPQLDLEAHQAVETCLAGRWPLSHWERLSELCDAMGWVLARVPSSEGQHVCMAACRVMRSAPTAALAGPLAGWVDAFACRIDAGRLTAPERQLLNIIAADETLDRERAGCFAPVSSRLRRQR